jgi:hypothetical protein
MILSTNDKYEFIECIAAFNSTFYGTAAIAKKYQSDKTIFYPQLEKHSIEELKSYFMPMILDGITYNRHGAGTKKVGLDNFAIVTVAEVFDKTATKYND